MKQSAEDALAAQDIIMADIINFADIDIPLPHQKYFESLVGHIVSQQLSVRAAATIYSRLVTLVDNQLLPERIIDLPEQQLRTAGLSSRKVRYVKSLATAFLDSPEIFNKLETMNDEQVIARLVELDGIGRWTAEMFLIFTMARGDVFAVDDLGLRRAIERYYSVPRDSPKHVYLKIAETWQPSRTLASLYLWASLDKKPVKELLS